MAAEHRQRGSYSAGLATRESILVAAMTLISRAGYHGFSLRDVGRMVGISHPAVIYHYPSKEALLLAVVQRYEESFGLVATRIDETSGVLVEGGIIPADIAQMAVAMMRVAKRDDARTIMDLDCILAVEAASPDHPAHDHFAHRFDIIHEFLESEVARLAEEGKIPGVLTPSATACALIRNWYGIAVHSRYVKGEDAERHTIAGFLADCGRTLAFLPETVLGFATGIPEDLADIFARTLKVYRSVLA